MPRFDAARRAMELLRSLTDNAVGRSATPHTSTNPCGETEHFDPRPDVLQSTEEVIQACQDGDRPFREAMASWANSISPVYPMSDEELESYRKSKKKGKPRVLVCGRIANLDNARQLEPKKKKAKKKVPSRATQAHEPGMTATAGYIYTPYLPLYTTNGTSNDQEPQFITRVVRARSTNASGSGTYTPTFTVTGPGLTPEELERQVQGNQERRDQIGSSYEQLMEEFETSSRRLHDQEAELIARAERRLEENRQRLEFERGLAERRLQIERERQIAEAWREAYPDNPF